jgi:hypothetical protein
MKNLDSSKLATPITAAMAKSARVDYRREFGLQSDLHDVTLERITERATVTSGVLSEILHHTCSRPGSMQQESAPRASTPEGETGLPFHLIGIIGEEDEED